MEQSDFLTTSAQIAVGLAGFTGVASVFGRDSSAVPHEVQSERLRAMIEAAQVAVVFALVPLLLLDLNLAEDVLWRVACGLFLTGWTAVFVITVRRGFKVLRNVGLKADRSWRAIVGVLGAMSFGSLFAGVVGLRPSNLYLLALLFQLVLCALFFYRFFLSMHSGGSATRS